MHWTSITNTFILHIEVNREPGACAFVERQLVQRGRDDLPLPFIGRNPRKTKS
jgi:hypothetical protein